MRAFVVEDNPVDLKLWSALLREGGHDPMTWTTLDGALDEICQHRPDVVLLDLNLSGFDGLDLVRAMRSLQDVCSIPVLAITAYAQSYSRTEIFAAGCTALEMKPVDTRHLIDRLQSLCLKPPGEGSP